MSDSEERDPVAEVLAGRSEAETLGEKIRAMADENERDAEEEEAAEEEEPTPEPESFADLDPLSRALITYIGSVQEILGPEVPIHPCPYCQGKGFEPMQLAKDPHSDVCPECNGYGKVATGSFVEGNEVRACQNCNGWGYKPHGSTVSPAEMLPQTEPVKVLTTEEVERIAADARAKVGIVDNAA